MVGGVGTDTNCPILTPRSVSDGGERARRRRTTNHATTPVIKATPTMPPTMPPVIAPAFELFCEVAVDDGLVCGVEVDNELLCEVEVDDEPPDTLGVMLDCETWLVDVGTNEDVPVTSGRSTRQVNICACTENKGHQSHLLWLAPHRRPSCHPVRVRSMTFLGKAGEGERGGTTDVSM